MSKSNVSEQCLQCGSDVSLVKTQVGDKTLPIYKCSKDEKHLQVETVDAACPACTSKVENDFCTNTECMLAGFVRMYDPPMAHPEQEQNQVKEAEKSPPAPVDLDEDDDDDDEGVGLSAGAIPASPAMMMQGRSVSPKGQVMSEEAFQRIVSDLADVSLSSDFYVLKAAGEKAALIKKDARLVDLQGEDPDLFLKIQDLIKGETALRKERQFNFDSLIQRGIDFSLLDEDISVSLARKRAEHLDGICKRKEFSKHLFELFQGHSQKPVLEDIQTGVELRTAQENERKKKEAEMAQKEQEKKQEAEAQAQAAAAAQAKAEQDALLPTEDEQRILTVLMDLLPLDWDDMELDDLTREELEDRKAAAEVIQSVQGDFNTLARMCQLGLHGQSMLVWKNFQAVAKGRELQKFDKLRAQKEEEEQQSSQLTRVQELKLLFDSLGTDLRTDLEERERVAKEVLLFPDCVIADAFGNRILALRQVADGYELRRFEEQQEADQQEQVRIEEEERAAQEKKEELERTIQQEAFEKQQYESGVKSKRKKEKQQRYDAHNEVASKVGALTLICGIVVGVFSYLMNGTPGFVKAGIIAAIAGPILIAIRTAKTPEWEHMAWKADAKRYAGIAIYVALMFASLYYAKDGFDQWRDPNAYSERKRMESRARSVVQKASHSQPSSRKAPQRRLPNLTTSRKQQKIFDRRAPRQIRQTKIDGGGSLKQMTPEDRCRELVRRVGGNRSGNTVRVVGCEKNGVKMVELKPGQMVLVKYVKGSIALSQKRFAQTFIKTGKEPACGTDCLYPHIPRNVIAVLGMKEKPFGLAYPPMPLKLWWFWRNTTGSRVAIVFRFNGKFLADSGLAKNGDVNPVVFSYSLHSNGEYEKLKAMHRRAR